MAKRRPNRLLTDAFREIKNTRSRFISLMVLSALAVCFLAGLRATAPDMKHTADLYLDQQKLMDLRVLSTLGLTDDDVAALNAAAGVELAEGAYTVDAIVGLENNDYNVKVMSISSRINLPRLVEGRMPQAADECLVEPLFLEETGYSVGDVITLNTGTGTYEDALAGESFTIVGTADSPLYIGIERGSSSLGSGRVTAFLLLPESAFTLDYYTDVYLLADGTASMLCYSDDYEDAMDALTDSLDGLKAQREQARFDQVKGEAEEKLADAQQEYDDAEAEVNQELADARKELEDARKELDDGWQEYRDGQETLDREIADAKQEIADGERDLADALKKLTDGEQDYLDGKQELADGWQEYYDGLADFEEGRQKYEDALKKYEDGLKKYQDGYRQYQDGLAEYEDGEAALDSAWYDLEAGRQQLQQEQQNFDSGITALRLNLAALDPALSFSDNQSLLSAMADSAQAAVIDAALDGARTNLSNGITLLNGISQLQSQLGVTDLAELAGQQSALQARLYDLVNTIIPAKEAELTALHPSDVNYEQQRAQLQNELIALQGEKSVVNGKLTLIGMVAQRDAAGLQYVTAEQLQAQLDGLYTTVNGVQVPLSTAVLLAGKQQLDQGWQSYYTGLAEFDAGQAELDDAWDTLWDARLELEDAKAELDQGKTELDDAKAELDDAQQKLADAYQELLDGQAELDDARKELDDGWKEYQDGRQELADARQTLEEETAKGQQELADALQELTDGEAEYADGLKEYEDGVAEAAEELADARQKLADARSEIDELDECDWYLLGRNTNAGYVSYGMDADRMGNLASVFPLIFFLVAALVCLTTMTRMVEEQRVTIGGLKALGFSRGAIAVKYVGYGFLASTAGALIGLAVGLTLLPWIICNAWGIIYTVGEVQYGLEPVTSCLACLAAIGTVTLSALCACFSTLTAVPAQLMRPKAPPMGKRILLERITPLWRRLSFNYKVSLRNLFRYQKRFWMTVIGIGGCAALIVTAFGLRGSIFDVMDKQYDELFYYAGQVGLAEDVKQEDLDEVAQTLNGSALVNDWLLCHSESVDAETERYTVSCYLQVFPDQESLERFVNLRHRQNDTPVVLPDDGVVLTEKLSILLGVEAGDTFTLDGDKRVEVRVADVTEHYIHHYIYMTQEYYQTLMGAQAENNMILLSYPSQSEEAEALDAQLVLLDAVTSVSRISDTRNVFTSSLASMDYAVILIIVCAAALAFVVLYNLTNINITERMRELATLKVLGFYNGELSAYVYRENVFLTIFGVALGLVMGKLLHQWLILTVEIDLLMFGRTLQLSSYLYAVALTVLFSFLVNLSARRKLKKLDMVESLKTVE